MEMKKYKLGDVLEEFHSGNNIKAADIKDVGEYPVFGANGLRGYTDRYNCDGDVAIIGRQGAYCGNVKFFSGKAYYTEHAVIAKPKKGFDAKYLACKLPFYQLEKYQGQSAQPGLSVGTLSLIEVELPSYENQKEVALVLSALDKRIENLRAQNRVLEQTAKTIYDYTFLQCAGHQTTYNKTLNRNIPTNWEVKKLGDCLASISTGLNPRQNFTLGNGSIKYITVKNLTLDGSIDYSGCDFIDENARAKVHKRSNIKVGDILFASISPLGRCYLIQEKPEDWDINESVFSISPADFTTSYYLYSFLRSKEFVAKAEQRATGSIFLGIRVDTLKKMEVLWPDSKTLGKFNALIEPIFKKQLVNTKQIETLTTQRNTLLPLLMTGQVEV